MAFYKVTAEADPAKPARLDLFGRIGGGFWDNGFDENTFREDMALIDPDQPLDIFINSQGGSVFAAMAIYNIIGAHRGAVTIRVTGMAASAATIITCAPDARVVMPAGSMMLIHPVRAATEPSTVDELKNAAEGLEKIKQSVIDIYEKKTGMSRADIEDLMTRESYLTAFEAVELGFADEMDETETIVSKVLEDAVMVGGLQVSAELFNHAPKGFISDSDKSKGAVKMDLKTLKAEHPDIVQAIRAEALAEGAANERARILAIEEIATEGHADLVQKAKANGAMTAEMLAVEILKADKARTVSMLKNRNDDAKALEGIGSDGNEGLKPEAEKKQKEEALKNEFIETAKRAFSGK